MSNPDSPNSQDGGAHRPGHDPQAPLPALRGVEGRPVVDDAGNATHFVIQDATRFSEVELTISAPGYYVLSGLDGARNAEQVAAYFRDQTGHALPVSQVQDFVSALDEALLLDSPRFRQAYEAAERDYRRGVARDNRPRWGTPEEIEREIRSVVAADESEAVPQRPPTSRLTGLIAPHLDYQRGSPAYRSAYQQVRAAGPFDRYVILGTNHFGRAESITATTKDFRTPFGEVRTDRQFIAALERAVGSPLTTHEFDHVREHSIELQVHLLQALFPEHPFEIVPILCPSPCGESGMAPADGYGPNLDDFADALGALVQETDKPTLIIAGADLSHIGQNFGDAAAFTERDLERVERSDRELLQLLSRREEDRFVEHLRGSGNPTRVCSPGCIYALMRALPEADFELLHYHQTIDFDTDTHVSCAAAALTDA